MANTYLTRTSGTATNVNKYTFSAWIKRSLLTSSFQPIFGGTGSTLANYHDSLFFNNSTDKFIYQGATSGSTEVNLQTSASYRDVSAWYHVVVAYDSTQITASNRVKIYINGVQETSFSTETYPAQNRGTYANGRDSSTITISKIQSDAVYFDGAMSHIHFIDGTAYDASAFGSTDATTGEWEAKTSPSVTYGNNGFFILKDGNGITDQSGEGNDFTLGGGTLTDLKDNPDNVFATLNPLQSQIGGATFSLGNTKLVTTNGSPYTGTTVATLGVSSGKWYWETKLLTSVSSTYPIFSIVGENCVVSSYLTSTLVGDYVTYTPSNGNSNEIYERYNDGSIENNYSYGDGSTINVNDIIGCALDKDNGKVYWSINGTWVNSGDPVNGTNPASSNVNNLRGDFVFPAYGDENYLSSAIFETNFGNGYFGTTAVSSAGTNASDNGIFEYDVPTGYTALSTKGLNL